MAAWVDTTSDVTSKLPSRRARSKRVTSLFSSSTINTRSGRSIFRSDVAIVCIRLFLGLKVGIKRYGFVEGSPLECQVLGTASLLTSDDQLYSPVCGQTGVARLTCSSQVARGKSSGSHPSRECMLVFFSAGQSGDFTCRMILGRRHTAIPKEQRHIVSSLPTVQCNATGYAAPFRGRRHTLAGVEGMDRTKKLIWTSMECCVSH